MVEKTTKQAALCAQEPVAAPDSDAALHTPASVTHLSVEGEIAARSSDTDKPALPELECR